MFPIEVQYGPCGVFSKKHSCFQELPAADSGIRCHNRITAFFLRLFGKIVTIHDQQNRAVYLNRSSLEQWLLLHQDRVEEGKSWEERIVAVLEKFREIPEEMVQVRQSESKSRFEMQEQSLSSESESSFVLPSFAMDFSASRSDPESQPKESEKNWDPFNELPEGAGLTDVILADKAKEAAKFDVHQMQDAEEYLEYPGGVYPKQMLGTRSLMWWKRNEAFGAPENVDAFEASFNRMMALPEFQEYRFEHDMRAEGDCGPLSIAFLFVLAAKQLQEERVELFEEIHSLAEGAGDFHFTREKCMEGAKILEEVFAEADPLIAFRDEMLFREKFNVVALCIRELMVRHLHSDFAPMEERQEILATVIGESAREIERTKDGSEKPYLSVMAVMNILERYQVDVPILYSERDDPVLHNPPHPYRSATVS